MKNRTTGRIWTMAVGILAALMILCSPAFKQEASRLLPEATADAGKADDGEKQFVAVHSDAVTSSQAVEVESANPFVVQEIITEVESKTVPSLPHIQLPTSFFTTLLRSVISPQAP